MKNVTRGSSNAELCKTLKRLSFTLSEMNYRRVLSRNDLTRVLKGSFSLFGQALV